MISILQFLIIISLTFVTTIFIGRKLGFGSNILALIFSIHTCYCIVYWYMYTQVGYSDAIFYFNRSFVTDFDWTPGNYFVISITKVLADIFGLNMLNTFLAFNIFGIIGIQFLLRVLLDIWPRSRNFSSYMPYFIILLPGHSFWSSAIGKDGIAYLSVCILLYGLHLNKYSYLIVSLFLMSIIRPHIAFVMLISFLFMFTVSKLNKSLFQYLIFILAIVVIFYASSTVLNYVGISSLSLDNLLEFIKSRGALGLKGGSTYANVCNAGECTQSSTFFPMVFKYLFSPLFYDAKTLPGIIFSLESLFLLIFFIKYIVFKLTYILKNVRTPIICYSLVYSTTLIVILSLTTMNTGIALRQKYMILPFLFIIGAMAAKDYYIKLKYTKKQL